MKALYGTYVPSKDAQQSQDHSDLEASHGTTIAEFQQFLADQNANTGPTLSDLDTYLNEAPTPYTNDFDILGWWKANEKIYPTLALLAKDILAIQVSSVASESVSLYSTMC